LGWSVVTLPRHSLSPLDTNIIPQSAPKVNMAKYTNSGV
jgi:hypothetical protein